MRDKNDTVLKIEFIVVKWTVYNQGLPDSAFLNPGPSGRVRTNVISHEK